MTVSHTLDRAAGSAQSELASSLSRRRFLRTRRRVTPRDMARWMEPFPYRQKIGATLRHGASRAAVG